MEGEKIKLVNSFYKNIYVNLSLLGIIIFMLIIGKFISITTAFRTVAIIFSVAYALHLICYVVYFFFVRKLNLNDILDVLTSQKTKALEVKTIQRRYLLSFILTIILLIAVFLLNYFLKLIPWIILIVGALVLLFITVKMYLFYKNS